MSHLLLTCQIHIRVETWRYKPQKHSSSPVLTNIRYGEFVVTQFTGDQDGAHSVHTLQIVSETAMTSEKAVFNNEVQQNYSASVVHPLVKFVRQPWTILALSRKSLTKGLEIPGIVATAACKVASPSTDEGSSELPKHLAFLENSFLVTQWVMQSCWTSFFNKAKNKDWRFLSG